MINAFLSSVVSFPGLGIGEFKVNSEAFRLPIGENGHPIMWYGIIIALTMVIGFAVSHSKAKFEGISSDSVFDLAIYLIIFCVIGARLYYVLSKPSEYHSFMDVIAIWNGGLGIYGGIIAGALTILVFSKITKIKTAKLLDVAAPGLIIGQAIGRWGNFFNVEAYGSVTKLPWRMCSPTIANWLSKNSLIDSTQYGEIINGTLGVHPTFLYESLWNILGFILIMKFYKKKKFDGQMVLFYAVWYGFGRFFIEGLRTDSLYLLEGVFGKTIRVSQLVAAICVIVGAALLITLTKKAKYDSLENEAYEAMFTEKGTAPETEAAFEIKNETTTADADESSEISDSGESSENKENKENENGKDN